MVHLSRFNNNPTVFPFSTSSMLYVIEWNVFFQVFSIFDRVWGHLFHLEMNYCHSLVLIVFSLILKWYRREWIPSFIGKLAVRPPVASRGRYHPWIEKVLMMSGLISCRHIELTGVVWNFSTPFYIGSEWGQKSFVRGYEGLSRELNLMDHILIAVLWILNYMPATVP